MSVIGTSIATIIAIYGGFTMAFITGAVMYAASGALGAVMSRRYRSIIDSNSST
jgi:hypothetical protein